MTGKISREVLLGLVAEARGYLPTMRKSLEQASTVDDPMEHFGTIHRYAHSIKGAAGMVGLPQLAEIANYLEEGVEQVAAGQIELGALAVATFRAGFDSIERTLVAIEADRSVPGSEELKQVVEVFRRLRGLPESGDHDEWLRVAGGEGSGADDQELETEDLSALFGSEDASQSMASDDDQVDSLSDGPSPEVLDSFRNEAQDGLNQLGDLLRQASVTPDNQDSLGQLRRIAHSLKGSSAMIGLADVSSLVHRMEDLLDLLSDRQRDLDRDTQDLLFDSLDLLEDMVFEDQSGSSNLDERRRGLELRFVDLLAVSGGTETPTMEALGEGPVIDLEALRADAATGETTTGGEPAKPAELETIGTQTSGAGQFTRVANDRLDELIRLVSELVVNRSTFEQHLGRFNQEVEEIHFSLARLNRLSNRLESEFEVLALGDQRVAAGGLALVDGSSALDHRSGFDSLEFDRYTDLHLVTRSLAETRSDIAAIGHSLSGTTGNFETYLSRLTRLTSEVQERMMRLRMAPISELTSRLHRTVRVTARQVGKEVDLVLEGQNTELDKMMREELADSLLHILRNAVDHGVERPSLRLALGKPRRGTIVFRAFYEGTHVVIQIEDDGAGIDPERLRRSAVENGYLTEVDAKTLADRRLFDLLFLPGFSTATTVDEVSGRGVGLDVVKSHVTRSKGTIDVQSREGQGTVFTIRLPLTLALLRAVLVRVGSEVFAISESTIGQILRIDKQSLEQVGTRRILVHEDKVYSTSFLSGLLPLPTTVSDVEKVTALIIEHAEEKHALLVDEVVEAREIAVKSLGLLLQNVSGISGATIMGDGGVVLIVDPVQLVSVSEAGEAETLPSISIPKEVIKRQLEILIVDDSVSVRRVLSSLVQGVGWTPLIARDGVEALELMRTLPAPPSAILLDIEMPRMDGFELLATLRARTEYSNLPIIMLTSRAGGKHRQRALELGVSEYLVKPFRDETLISVVRRLVRQSEDS